MKKGMYVLFGILAVILIVMIAGCGGSSTGNTTISPSPSVAPSASVSPSPSSSVSPSPSPSLPAALIHYTFDSSPTSDSSGNSLNATGFNSPQTTTSQAAVGSGSLDLSANAPGSTSAAYLQLPTFTLNGSFTVSCWMKFIGLSNWSRLFDFQNTTGLKGVIYVPKDHNNYTTFVQNIDAVWANSKFGNNANADTTFPLNTWIHLVFVYDHTTVAGSSLTMYINGNVVTTVYDPWIKQALGTVNSAYLAYSPFDDEIQGYIDDFRVYDQAITATEAAALYNMKN